MGDRPSASVIFGARADGGSDISSDNAAAGPVCEQAALAVMLPKAAVSPVTGLVQSDSFGTNPRVNTASWRS